MEQFSQTRKARAARRWRATNRLKKRYDGPLKEYIKIKYNDIYQEYDKFYKVLDQRHPDVRDLWKSPTFIKWAKSVRQEQQQESESTESSNENQVPSVQNPRQQQQQPESESTESSNENQVPPVQNPPHEERQSLDILSAAIRQALPEGLPPQISEPLQEILPDIPEFEQDDVDQIIERIINDMEQDEAVQALLNPVVDQIMGNDNGDQINSGHDEGIELNFEDEIDVEPFDYNLEVDF